jgi:putative transcriptional regulator
MKVKLNELIKEKNVSLLWLSQKVDVSYSTLWNFSENKTTMAKFEMIEKICIILDCEIGELLHIENGK